MPTAVRAALYAALGLAVAAISLFSILGGDTMRALGLSWEAPVNLFALLMTLALGALAALELRRPGARRTVVLFFVGSALLILGHFRQLPPDDYRDYGIYEVAAQALAAGQNPYATGKYYLYPPAFVRTMTAAYTWLDPAWGTAGDNPGQARAASTIVHFLFQALQYLLALACWWLLYLFLGRAGLAANWSAALASVLLAANTTLSATMLWNQTNLMVLAPVLAAMVLFERRPFLAGACLAAGIEVKLYPAVLLLPFVVRRRLWVPAGAAAALAASFLLETGFLSDFTLWAQFIAHLRSFPAHFGLTNQGAYSLIFNTLALPAGEAAALRVIGPLFAAFQVAVFGLVAYRFWRRERLAAATGACGESALMTHHLADMVALFLLVSPITWQHQFILALPLLAWAIAVRGGAHPGLVTAAFFLLNLAPLFFAYPLEYHRVAAVFILLYVTRPTADDRADAAGLQGRLEALFGPEP